MPDDSMDALVNQLQSQVERKILPVKAGDVSPMLMRASDQLRKAYPADMYGTTVRDLPQDQFNMRSLGQTPWTQDEMQLNPTIGLAHAQPFAENILAHELEHVRQNRTRDVGTRQAEAATLPYLQRPDEIAAMNATDAYRRQKPEERGFYGQTGHLTMRDSNGVEYPKPIGLDVLSALLGVK